MNRLHTHYAVGFLLVAAATTVSSQESPSPSQGVPIADVIAAVAQSSKKTFIVDPRVQGNVTIVGRDPLALSYEEFLSVLQVHGYAAVGGGDTIKIIPDAGVRTAPTTLVSGNERRAATEHVSKVIELLNVPAASLVPILRPLLPQNAHLAAVPCTNTLLIVDTYENVQRIEALARALDTGTPYTPPLCSNP